MRLNFSPSAVECLLTLKQPMRILELEVVAVVADLAIYRDGQISLASICLGISREALAMPLL
jgi:hypothetical protein